MIFCIVLTLFAKHFKNVFSAQVNDLYSLVELITRLSETQIRVYSCLALVLPYRETFILFCESSFFRNLPLLFKTFKRLLLYPNIEHLFYFFHGKRTADKTTPPPIIITWYKYVISALPSLSECFLVLDKTYDWLIKLVQCELNNQSKVLNQVLFCQSLTGRWS